MFECLRLESDGSDERRLRSAVEAIVPREARAISRGVIALAPPAADVGHVVRCLNLLDVRSVRRVGVGQSVVARVDCRQGEPVDLGSAAVAAGSPLHLQEVLVALDLSEGKAGGGTPKGVGDRLFNQRFGGQGGHGSNTGRRLVDGGGRWKSRHCVECGVFASTPFSLKYINSTIHYTPYTIHYTLYTIYSRSPMLSTVARVLYPLTRKKKPPADWCNEQYLCTRTHAHTAHSTHRETRARTHTTHDDARTSVPSKVTTISMSHG